MAIVVGVAIVSPVAAQQRVTQLRTPDWRSITGVADPPSPAARAAVLLDSDTGTVLYAKNPHLVLPAASLTKVVAIHSAVVASRLGEVDLDRVFTPGRESWASSQPEGSSLMFLGPEQRLTIRDLLPGLAISSGNDAAVALARQVDGSVAAFAARMNRMVQNAGFVSMSFVEPSGLNPLNLITALEYAGFIRLHLQTFPELISSLYSRRTYTYPQERNMTGPGEWPPITQSNRNLLLDSYAGADGVKTGYIDEVGYNLAATAERDGRRLIAVVLGVQADNHAEGGRIRAADAAALLDYGFAEFQTLSFGHPDLAPVRVFGGRPSQVVPVAGETISVTIPSGAADRLRGDVEQRTEVIAPVPEGAVVGTLRVTLDGVSVGEAPIFLPEVERGGFLRRIWDGIALFFRSLFGGERPVEGSEL